MISLKDKPVEDWSKDEVQDWFVEGKFAKYASKFKGLGGKSLTSLTKDDFQKITENVAIGIAIYNAVTSLKKRYYENCFLLYCIILLTP